MRIPTTHPALVDPRYRVPLRGPVGPPSAGTLNTGPLVKEPARLNMFSAVIALCICVAIAVAFRMATDDMSHWFMVPIVACGVLCAIDIVDWLRGRVDTLDPVAVVGIAGLHFFMMAPLLHVYWDVYLGNTGIIHPPDWRDWFGGMAILNFLGLSIYHLIRAFAGRRTGRRATSGKVWVIDKEKFRYAIWVALFLTAMLQMYTYARFGGISGFVAAYEALSQLKYTDESFVGMGASFTISESFPILAMMAFAVYARRRGKKISWPTIFAVLAVYVVLKMFFGGLRGSRSTTLFAVVWAAGIVHFYLRPIPKKIVLLGLGLLIVFLYVYGFYKNAGVEGLKGAFDSESRGRVAKKTGRSYYTVLLGDLARADIQGHLLYRFMRTDRDVDYAYGKTYMHGAIVFIPRIIWPNRPDSKRQILTEAQQGKGKFDPKYNSSSHVTGMAGEAILNFGPYFVPVVFIPFALLIVTVRRWMHTWHDDDARRLILPYLIIFCITLLISDFDNDVFALFKQMLIPFFVLVISTKRIPRSRYAATTASFHPIYPNGRYAATQPALTHLRNPG